MYKMPNLRARRRLKSKLQPTQVIFAVDVEETCGGCPTIYDFKDQDGKAYYFRLRHGGARLVCSTTEETLISATMEGHDGSCDWSDVLRWARRHGIMIR